MTSVSELASHMEKHSIADDNIEYCGICTDALDNSKKVQLSCNHSYCYQCIYDWFQTRNSTSVQHYSNYGKPRECPYCRKDGGWLPLKDGYTPLKNIHKEYVPLQKSKKKYYSCKYIECGAPLKTKPGKTCINGGKSCYGNYCGIHKKMAITNPKNSN